MWKIPLAAVLSSVAVCAAQAQTPPPQAVQWQLQVLLDGQQIDAFDATTTVGQARTDTHHHVVTHTVGCKDQPGGSIDLQRTLTVAPLRADPAAVTLAIDAQETIEEPASRETAAGCKLPPQPRQVTASHPGLSVPANQWTTWTLVDKNPSLVYRVRANLVESP